MADNIDDLLTKEEQTIFQSPWALSMLKFLCAEHNAKADQFHKIHIETFDDVIKVIQEKRSCGVIFISYKNFKKALI
ncbi:MAG: hypothetical protein CMH26_04230 [Micavibrio sp.]|nr:hypothetical protein [Micavibrio sp.]|tara:strand:+ start:94 stop:324 length:231 start_codon:yes stop_codon:yes gene_type:complete